ncbi:MAG: hypothetical protein CFK52_04105 [Chloracidobacterium sp. CP2_5A]|nr:MAG: hypothetical protein CFK52_04105 [Chloracidobacterium sp. CP2_5A]
MMEVTLKDAVGWTLPDAQSRLGDLEWRAEDRPDDFRYATFGEGNKHLRVIADGWQVAAGKLCARYARIQAALADVATLMVYPTASPDLLPVFACEWVILGDRAHVLVLDVECVGGSRPLRDRASEALAPLHARYVASLPTADNLPQWFSEIREPWAFFTSGDLARLSVMREAFQHYLDATAATLYAPWLKEARAGEDHPAIQAYKRHHAAHSPGYALLAPRAGESWTRRFLHDWHFGPARPAARER